MKPRHILLQIKNLAVQPEGGGIAEQGEAADHKVLERQRRVAEKPLREAVQGGHQRIIEREKTDAPQQTPAQGQRQPQRHAAGDGGQAEIEAPESGVGGRPLYKFLRRRERGQQDQSAGALQAKDHLIAGGGWRRGDNQHAFPVVQVALAGDVAVAKGALFPGGIAAQRSVVNGQMVDKRGAQLQPARLPGKPRSRQLAAQPPGFSRITKGGDLPGGGELVCGQGGEAIDGHLAAGVRVPLDRNINAHLARRRLRLWGDQQQE